MKCSCRFCWWGFLPGCLFLLLLGGASSRGAGTGLSADYYDNVDFTSLKFSRVDPMVAFDWGTGSPSNTIAADTFSVRWFGQVQPAFSEVYRFHVEADDGARLWVNDRLITARTVRSAAVPEISGTIALVAGKPVNLRLEFIETSGTAKVRLSWSSPSQPRETIPQAALYPTYAAPELGSILAEAWTGLPGTNIASLTGDSAFPNRPALREFLTGFECLLTNWADDFGTKVSGFIVPAVSGNYSFAVAGSDTAQLYLSTNGVSSNKILIAQVPSATGFREFTKFPTQVSGTVALAAQQKYYVELLHKAGVGADHFSVGWKLPGSTNFSPIPADSLAPAGLDRSAPAQNNYLDTLATARPRLLASPQRFEWLRRNIHSNSIAQLTSWWTGLSNSASTILAQAPNQYVQDDRDTILGISRSVLDRVYKLATVYRMNGDTNFAERAWTELEAAANFPDWHPAHFLDTAEMTHAFAMGYDWLNDYWTPARLTVLRQAIQRKGLAQSLTIYTNNSGWAASSANNWNLVCNGGMILGALALGLEGESTNEFILSRAVASAALVMQHYTTDGGGWYEGPGYWDYTTDYNMRLMAGLESALGSDFKLSATRAVWETGIFAMGMVGPLKWSFNFADAGAGNMRGPQLFWMARRYLRPEYAWHERNNTSSAEALDLLWYDTRGNNPDTGGVSPDNYFRGATGTTPYFPADAVTLRTRWQDGEATFIGFKAGEMGASHGNLDAGSFVLDALGTRWAVDLGGDNYALPGYFGSQRWTYYRLRAEGHNTLVINPGSGADQVVGSKPPIVLFGSEPDGGTSFAVADLTSCYNITRAWRGVQLLQNRKWMLVQDEIRAATPANVWWFMHFNSSTTTAQVETNGDAVMLTRGTDRLWVKILTGAGTFAISNAVPLPTSPHPTNQNANADYLKLAIHLTAVTNTTLAVLMAPLTPGQSPPAELPAVVPLLDWAALPGSVFRPTNTPPVIAETNFDTPPGHFVDVDLRALASDAQTSPERLLFSVASGTGGSATLLPDGHTARFVPESNFIGVATFNLIARDAWPDSRMKVYYDFEPPESLADFSIFDSSGNLIGGQLEIVGSGAALLASNRPAALSLLSTQSLILTERGDLNGARVVCPLAPADLDFNEQSWTAAGWFQRSASTNDDFIFYLGTSDGFGSPDEFQLYGPSGQSSLALRHYIATSTTDVDMTVPGVTLGQWHHFAISFESTNANSGILRLYRNGTLAGSDYSVALNMPAGKMAIFGGHCSTSFAVTRWFNGRLDDCAVFSGVLSQVEIQQLAARPAGYLGGSSTSNAVSVNVQPVRPVLSAGGIRNGLFQFTVTGKSGPDYTVQTSTNLADPEGWTTLLVSNSPALPFTVVDPVSATEPAKFYRVLLSP